ncbi:MAG: hypothetical protein HYT27_00990 [Parcubacteria group bacterium]|nr:hypothetical protein [Parcubacteria group bacterium]
MKIVLGFSFGMGGSEAGISNKVMAQVISKLQPDIISVQKEIGKALRDLGVTLDHEVFAHQTQGKYLDTEEVARQMITFLKTKKLHEKYVSVIAHPAHISRCVRILRKLGLQKITLIHADIPYDPLSEQIWVRSPLLYRTREILAFPLYLYRGYFTA